jgi:molybdopterin-containing oxidoreductase family membrane subunit
MPKQSDDVGQDGILRGGWQPPRAPIANRRADCQSAPRWWMAALAAAVVAGVLLWWRQWDQGLALTGMSRDVAWGLYIGQFTFFVGVAASAVTVVLPYYLHSWKAFGRVVILGEMLAIASVVVALLFVFVDLGRPDRLLNVVLHPSPSSLMFWDLLALAGYLALNVILARAALAGPPAVWTRALVLISIPWAVSIHTITAFLYAGLAGRPFWLTAAMAPRFLASAFAAGPALLILLCRAFRYDAGDEALRKLRLVMTYAMTANVFLALMEVFTAFYSGIPEQAAHYSPWTWLSGGLAAAALAMALGRSRYAPAAVFASLVLDKGVVLIPAGFIPSPGGAVTPYIPTAVELGIVLAIWCAGALLVTVLFRIAIAARAAEATAA